MSRLNQVQEKKSYDGSGQFLPPMVHRVVDSGRGRLLEHTTRNFMESRFGYDFSDVRIHDYSEASESAWALNALAYTVDRNIVFREGHYLPNTEAGRRLLTHELAHVVQQGRGGWMPDLNAVANDRYAEAAASIVTAIPHGRLTVEGVSGVGLMLAKGPDVYVKPTPETLGVVKQMEEELAKLRVSIPPAKSASEEAARTFAIVKVVDQNSAVKISTTGSYVGKGPHAELDALGKLDLGKITETDTTLLMVDQLPCDDKCTPAINVFRGKVKGEFRVFTKVKVDPLTRMGGSPKTAALSSTKTSQELMELTEFQKLKTHSTSGGAAITSAPAVKAATPPAAAPKTVEPKISPSTTRAPLPEGLSSRGLPRPSSLTATGEVLGDVGRLRSLMRGFSRGMKVFFSPKVQIPLTVVLEFLNAIQALNMASSGLRGEGFTLVDEIKKCREIKEKADLLLNHYKEGYHDDLSRAVTLATILIFKGSTDAKNEMANGATSTIPILQIRLSEAQELLDKVTAIGSEADAKRKIAEKLLASREFAILTAPTGTVALAQVFAVSEDMSRIRGLMNDSKNDLTELVQLIKADIDVLKFYR